MARNEYRSLQIPEGLARKIEKYVDQSNGSYVSIFEVVREALREFLKKTNRGFDT